MFSITHPSMFSHPTEVDRYLATAALVTERIRMREDRLAAFSYDELRAELRKRDAAGDALGTVSTMLRKNSSFEGQYGCKAMTGQQSLAAAKFLIAALDGLVDGAALAGALWAEHHRKNQQPEEPSPA